MVDTPSLLIPQQTPPSHLSHPHHQQQQQQQQHPNPQQQPWTDDADKRKWNQEFGEFDINSHANKMFRTYICNATIELLNTNSIDNRHGRLSQ